MGPQGAKINPRDFGRRPGKLAALDPAGFLPLPPPYDKLESEPVIRALSADQASRYECDLDGISAVLLPRPESEDQKRELIEKFLSGLKKLFNTQDNWTFHAATVSDNGILRQMSDLLGGLSDIRGIRKD